MRNKKWEYKVSVTKIGDDYKISIESLGEHIMSYKTREDILRDYNFNQDLLKYIEDRRRFLDNTDMSYLKLPDGWKAA